MRWMSITDQEDRRCDACGSRFLSGVVHVERGYALARMCLKCAGKPDTLDRLRDLTKQRMNGKAGANA